MHEPFRFLTAHDQRLLQDRAECRHYKPSETILEEGSRRRAIFVIRSGTVRIERDHLGRGVPFAVLEKGEIFGEMSFLEDAGASASVVADGDVEVDVIEGHHVHTLLETVPGFATRFFHSLAVDLSERLRRTSRLALPPLSWG